MGKVYQVLVILAGVCLISDFGNGLFLKQLMENCQPICSDSKPGQLQTVPVYCGLFFRDQIKCRETPSNPLVKELGDKVSGLDGKVSGLAAKIEADFEKLNTAVGNLCVMADPTGAGKDKVIPCP